VVATDLLYKMTCILCKHYPSILAKPTDPRITQDRLSNRSVVCARNFAQHFHETRTAWPDTMTWQMWPQKTLGKMVKNSWKQ